MLHQALSVFREFRDRRMEGKALLNLAELDAARGDIPAALGRGREAIAVLEDTQDQWLLDRARRFSVQTAGKAGDVARITGSVPKVGPA